MKKVKRAGNHVKLLKKMKSPNETATEAMKPGLQLIFKSGILITVYFQKRPCIYGNSQSTEPPGTIIVIAELFFQAKSIWTDMYASNDSK